MLVSLSTQLARAKRKKTTLVFTHVSTLEIAVAVVRAAEHARQPIVLTIDASHPLLYSLTYQVAAVLQLGRMSSAEVTVEVVTGANHIAIEQGLVSGAQVISPKITTTSDAQTISLLGWASNQAKAHGSEIVADLSDYKEGQWYTLAQKLGENYHLAGVRIPVLNKDEKLMTMSLAGEIKQLKLPCLAMGAEYKPSHLRRFGALGLLGVSFTSELDEMFTAGLRASLRNREHNHPRYYLPKGQLAVEEFLIRMYSIV